MPKVGTRWPSSSTFKPVMRSAPLRGSTADMNATKCSVRKRRSSSFMTTLVGHEHCHKGAARSWLSNKPQVFNVRSMTRACDRTAEVQSNGLRQVLRCAARCIL